MIWGARTSGAPKSVRASRAAGRAARVNRVRLDTLQPDPEALLGQVAYLELALFEMASSVAGHSSDLAARQSLTRVAAATLEKHHGLVALLAARGIDSASAMGPFVDDIERYRRRLSDARWPESVLTLHLVCGLLDDFFSRLAAGLPGDEGKRAAALLAVDVGHAAMADLLRDAVQADQRLASRLALWGRRTVGDTLLVARSAMPFAEPVAGGLSNSEDVRIEPVLTELIAAHTRRMDALGLTA